MSNKKLKIIFIGTPDFAIPSLYKLINEDRFDVEAVITQPDKKIGRKQELAFSPIKTTANKFNLTVFQPEKIRSLANEIEKLGPDLIVVAAYSQIIPEEIINIPKYGCVNIHGSLLPKYRGASCVQAAILNGDKETGITIMKMDKGLDTGSIIFQEKIKITGNDTTDSLHNKLSLLGSDILIPTLKKYISGKIIPQPQNNETASYAKELKKTDAHIDWNKDALYITRFIRAMWSWPIAYSNINCEKFKTIKIYQAVNSVIKIKEHKPGEIFIYNNDLAIQCSDAAIIVEKIQPEGKNIMSGREFINGYKHLIGGILN